MSGFEHLLRTKDGGKERFAWKLAVRILAGPLRGMRWTPASRGKLLRVLLGSYEREQTALFARYVLPGSTVFDIGAHVGYYTLLGARLVRGEGRVLAFEPDPRNAHFLRRHVALNRLENVVFCEAAVGDFHGTANFAQGTGSGTGHLSDSGDLRVPIRRLDDVVRERGVWPTHLKIDVEGAELQVLRGSGDVLTCARPMIFLSTHSPPLRDECCRFLAELGYQFRPILPCDGSPDVLCIPEKPLNPPIRTH